MSNKIILLLTANLLILCFCSCKEKEDIIIPEREPAITTKPIAIERTPDSSVLVPIGRLLQSGNSVKTLINNKEVPFDTIDDGLGGYWAAVHRSCFKASQVNLQICIVKRAKATPASYCVSPSYIFLSSSPLINWKNSGMANTAYQLYDDSKTISQNVVAFRNYITDKLQYTSEYADKFGNFTASTTFMEERGVCINFSRVLIAMCRSVHISARSVSGLIFLEGEIDTLASVVENVMINQPVPLGTGLPGLVTKMK